MKRIFSILLVLIMILSMIPATLAEGMDEEEKNFTPAMEENAAEEPSAEANSEQEVSMSISLSEQPKLYGEESNAQETGYEGAELPAGPVMGQSVIDVTPANAQYVLDGAYGSIDGKTIHFTAGTYGKLVIGRPTKYAGSHTEYRHGNFGNAAMTYADYAAYKNQSGYTETGCYNRAVSGVTFTADASVVLPGITVAGGYHSYGTQAAPMYDYVRDTGVWCEDTNGGYYSYCVLSNITFKGVHFSAQVSMDTSAEKTVFDDITFENCTFTIGSTAQGGNIGIHYYNEFNNGNVKDLVVKGCTFDTCYQGIYTSNVKGISVTDSTFRTTGHNAIAIQDAGACNHGDVVITGNRFSGINDRVIRFNNVGAGTRITITDNTVTDAGLSTEECIKATTIADGVVCTVHDNNWSGFKAAANEQLRDKVVVAGIGTEKYYSLRDAVTAAKDGDTVQLLADVELANTLTVNKTVMIDGTKADGRYKITFTGSGNSIFCFSGNNRTFTLENCEILNSGNVSYGCLDIASGIDGKVVVDHCRFGGTAGYSNLITHDSCNDDNVVLEFTNNVVDVDHGSLMPYLRQGSKIVGNTFKAIGKNRVASVVANGDDLIVITDNVFEGCTKNGLVCVNKVATTTNLQIRNNTYTDCTGNILRVESAVVLTADSEIVNTVGQNIIVVKDNESDGVLTITGGTYVGADAGFYLEGDASLVISGGAFSSDPTDHLAGGYTAARIGRMWYVGTTRTAEVTIGSAAADTDKNVSYVFSDNSAAVMTGKDGDIRNATGNDAVNVDVSASGAEQVILSATTVGAVAEAKESKDVSAEALTITTADAQVTFNRSAVDQMVASATDTVTVTVKVENASDTDLTDVSDENKSVLEFLKEGEGVEQVSLLKLTVQNEEGTALLNEDTSLADSRMTVRVKAPDGCKTVDLYYLKDGEAQLLAEGLSVDEEGYITVTLDHFSEYAMVGYATRSDDHGIDLSKLKLPLVLLAGLLNGSNSDTDASVTIATGLTDVTTVKVDGVVVDSKNYTVTNGTVVFTDAYLKTLSTGSHTVVLDSGTATAKTTITVKAGVVTSARTGDAGILLYGLMGAVAMAGSGVVIAGKKQR